MTDEYEEYRKKITNIKELFKTLSPATYGGSFISMRSGQPLPYNKFRNELKSIQNVSLQDLPYLDMVFQAWIHVTEDKVPTIGPLEDWVPEEITRVKKVLSEVKPSEHIREPEDIPEPWVVECVDISDYDELEKVFKEVDTEMKGTYGSPDLDVLVKSITKRRKPRPAVKPPELIVQGTPELAPAEPVSVDCPRNPAGLPVSHLLNRSGIN
jgi:hypothetical protein